MAFEKKGHTLRSIASDKTDTSAKRGDAFRVRMDSVVIVDGFNVRISDDDLREHIAAIAGALSVGLPIPPIEVWVNPETGAIELVDGHCRFQAYKQYSAENNDFDGYISAVMFEGTPGQRKMRIASSNKQMKLKPIELGRLYTEARDDFGMTRAEIATEAGVSLAHVDQMILLFTAKPEVLEAVERNEISATEAVKLTRDHGDDAANELGRRQVKAKELGKDKVTAKAKPVEPKKSAPSRPRIDLVVSNAVVLVNSLGRELEEAISAGFADRPIEVRADVIADLIMAVREMQQSGRALDADKQTELEV